MKYLLPVAVAVLFITKLESANAGAAQIVAAARSQIGMPYVFGGGDWRGPSKGGWDCSGLAQFSVYRGTRKIISRTAGAQYNDRQCLHIPYGSRKAGDLVFFGSGSSVEHVGILTGPNTLVHAPKPGDHVREASIWSAGRMHYVQRCFVNAYMPPDNCLNLSNIITSPLLKLLLFFK